MLMMLPGLGFKARAAQADAHDAHGVGFEGQSQHQLMLMMLTGLGFDSQSQHQLMLMMLAGLGSKARAAPADAHDARGVGFESQSKHQLMLMMLAGLGLKARASTS